MVEYDIKGQGSKLCFIIYDTGSGVTWILAGETVSRICFGNFVEKYMFHKSKELPDSSLRTETI